jgi:competence ComEA-like helix-hairpin-helix protein
LVDPTWQFHWQHWEDFVLQFMETKILCSLKVMDSFKPRCQLKQLFSGLNGSNDLLDISVYKPTNIKSATAGEQFPHNLNIHSFDTRYACEESYPLEWWKIPLIVKNYTNAKGIDIFLLLRCQKLGYLLLCMQLKWKENGTKKVEKLTYDHLKNMHGVNKGLIEDAITNLKQMKHRNAKDNEQLSVLNHSKVITILVTNKKFEGNVPNNCGVISREQFGQFFGPFGEIGAFYNNYTFKPKIEINFADKKELQRIDGIGPETAASIITYRNANGLFKSVEKLIEAIPRLKQYESILFAQCLFTVS